jgi:hypothetical protein
VKKVVDTSSSVKNSWFRKVKGRFFYRRIPITWQGYVLLIALLGLNFYSVFYFNLPWCEFNSILGFLVVLLLSIFVFQVIAIRKTSGDKSL